MKLPFTLGLKFIFRIILPGFVLALGFLPILRTLVDSLDHLVPLEYVFLAAILSLGWLVVTLDMPIYMIFEGRRYWFEPLRKLLINRERKRLQGLYRTARENEKKDQRKYLEASVDIRRFPLDESDVREVRYPTRLGNLLASYEEYSKRIYGMYQGFYWTRIWLTLDKDLREEIDNRQALADSTLYTVFSLYACAVLCAIYAILHRFDSHLIWYLPRAPFDWLLPVFNAVLGFFIYRQSLHVHAQFGETSKGVFDLHGPKVMFPEIVEAIAAASANNDLKSAPVEAQNMAAWVYLNNLRIRCPRCDKGYKAAEIRSHKCGPQSASSATDMAEPTSEAESISESRPERV